MVLGDTDDRRRVRDRAVVDLRGQFTGRPDHEIYQWAYDQYFDRCSRDYYVVMGGHAGAEPPIADGEAVQSQLEAVTADQGEIYCNVKGCAEGVGRWAADRKRLRIGGDAAPSIRLTSYSADIMIEQVR